MTSLLHADNLALADGLDMDAFPAYRRKLKPHI